jgi:hypothetical protein
MTAAVERKTLRRRSDNVALSLYHAYFSFRRKRLVVPLEASSSVENAS